MFIKFIFIHQNDAINFIDSPITRLRSGVTHRRRSSVNFRGGGKTFLPEKYVWTRHTLDCDQSNYSSRTVFSHIPIKFGQTGISAIRSADIENPTVEPKMKCIGRPLAWPFEIFPNVRSLVGPQYILLTLISYVWRYSYCWETVRRESMPRVTEMDVEMTTYAEMTFKCTSRSWKVSPIES